MKVVIADDSSLVRERLISLLSALKDVEIIGQAQDAREAMDSIQRLAPEAVILDIQMPGGSGIEVLRQIKQTMPPPIVIMLTNYAAAPYREACLALGADYFFNKSTEFEQLVEAVRTLLHRFDLLPQRLECNQGCGNHDRR